MTDLKQRVLAAVAAEPSLARPEAARRRLAALVGAGLISLTIFLLAGGIQPKGRPMGLWAATSLGATAIAATVLLLALRRGRSMLGRSAPLLVGLALATPALLLAWKIALSTTFPGMTEAWPERPGFRCLCLALATGMAPATAFFYLWRGTAPAHPRLTGTALGTAAGAFVWVLVDLWCPVAHFHHLLLGHVAPLILLAAIGAAAGGLLSARRR